MNVAKSLSLVFILVFLTSSCIIATEFVDASSAPENTWEIKAHMPEAVWGGSAAVVDGKIYVIGGSQNYMYDPATNVWAVRTPMPTPRNWFGIAVCENKIFTIGGSFFNGSTGEITYSFSVNEVYDPSTDTWLTKAPMPTARASVQANVANDEIYVMAGATGGGSTTVGLNEVYNVANDSWITKSAIPYPVVGSTSVVCGGKIYVFGGQDVFLTSSNIDVDFTQIYDPKNDSWTLGASFPTRLIGISGGATTGEMASRRIYLFGGANGVGPAWNTVQVFNPENNSWTYGASMPTPRWHVSVAVLDDQLYVIGGHPSNMPGGDYGKEYSWENELYTPFGYRTPNEPTSTPSVPEFQVGIIPLLLSVMMTAVLLVYLKKHKHSSLVKKV